MMNVPTAIIERRADLERMAEGHRDTIRLHEYELRGAQNALTIVGAQIAELDFVSEAFCEADCSVSGKAEAQGTASGATPGTPGAETAPAGEFEGRSGVACPHCGDVTEQSVLLSEFTCGNCDRAFDLGDARVFRVPLDSTKKPRAPKRDIRGMVLSYASNRPNPPTLDQLAAGVGVPRRVIDKAVAYWQAKGRLTLFRGIVALRDPNGPASGTGPNSFAGQTPEASSREDAVEIVGEGPVELEDLGFLHPEMARQALVGFLTRVPDSTMDEIREAGIEQAEVYQAEEDGVVIAKAHGLYALVESKAEAAE